MQDSIKLFLIVVFVFVGAIVNGQQPGYGVRAGINLSSFKGFERKRKNRFGFNAGVYYNKMLKDNFAIQPEAGVSLEGDQSISFTNLNLGVMGKYNYKNFMFEFGPQFGFILGDDDSKAKVLNVTIGIGGGYAFSEKIILGIRYNAGLSDVYDVDYGNITNNTFSFNAFFEF